MGGAARRTSLLIDALAGRGCRLTVLCRAGTLSAFRLQTRPHVRILEIPGFKRRRLGALLYVATAVPIGLVAAARSDAVLGVQLFSQSLVAGLTARLTRRPYFLFATTSGELGEAGYVRTSSLSSLRRSMLDHASGVVAQTEEAAIELRALSGAPVSVIANPVRGTDRSRLSGTPNVLFAGRFSEEKELLTLLEAWTRVVSRVPDARLLLAGAGGSHRSIEPQLRSRVEALGLGTSVTFLGWVDDVDSLYRSADVFVLPSRSEGMSNSLLEACAHGRVVVASRISSNVEVLGTSYPLLFDVSSQAALAHALTLALTDKDVRASARGLAIAAVSDKEPVAIAMRILDLVSGATRSARN